MIRHQCRAQLATCALLVTSHAAFAALQSAPVRVETATALKQVLTRVEPVFSPEAVAANGGALIAADVIIRTDGTVEAVNIMTGPRVLVAPTVAALKQWTFLPFFVRGRPERVVAIIDIALPDPQERAVEQYTAAMSACQRSLATKTADAEASCGRMVALSEALEPSRVVERVHALQYHGLSLLFSNRAQEALPRFERAIEMRKRLPGSDADADTALLLEMAAQTQIRLGNLAAADALYGSSIATLERAVEATPSFRDKYNDHLAVVLERAAELKRALGSSADANALDGRAASVPSAAPDAPLPAMRRDGNTILAGSLGPTLNGDDLRQLRALVPAGKETWLITASHELIAPDRRLLAEIYLDPDMEQANLRRGRVITAEAIVKSDAKLDGKKIWTDAKLTIGYAQVALPGRDPMDLRGHDDPNLPALVPQMAAGVSVTHAELVSVVAFIRSASSPSQGAAGFDFGELYKRVQPWPIADITKWSEDNLEVRLVPQTTARRGQRIKLKASGKGWTIVELEPVAW